MSAPKIAVAGCAGRMGRAVLSAIFDDSDATLVGGFETPNSPEKGQDLGRLLGANELGLAVLGGFEKSLYGASALIDFTAPAATLANAQRCAENGIAHIIGTTGFTPEQETALKTFADKTAIVKSGNMSLGVNLLSVLVEKAAAALGEAYDIEIFEMHHRHKVDAPSGTALLLGAAAAEGRGVDLHDATAPRREGVGDPRRSGDIGFSVARGGGVIGEHAVMFTSEDEMIELRHRAFDRTLFARGAVAAAKWASGQSPGFYGMRDVLGL